MTLMQKQLKESFHSPDDIIDFDAGLNLKRKKQRRIDNYYTVTHYLSLAAFCVFLVLLLLERNVPDYFVGLIGSIVGYYLSRKPFE